MTMAHFSRLLKYRTLPWDQHLSSSLTTDGAASSFMQKLEATTSDSLNFRLAHRQTDLFLDPPSLSPAGKGSVQPLYICTLPSLPAFSGTPCSRLICNLITSHHAGPRCYPRPGPHHLPPGLTASFLTGVTASALTIPSTPHLSLLSSQKDFLKM